MITRHEVVYAIAGTLRLARRDSGGFAYFDESIRGFWRSFNAALLAVPLHAVMVLVSLAEHPVAATGINLVLTETIAYVIGWTAFPLAMFHVCERLDRSDRLIRYVVAYNWASLLQLSALVPVTLIVYFGLLPDGLSFPLSLVVTGWVLYFQWFIARHALDVSTGIAIGIVILDIVINLFVSGVARAIES